MTSLWVRAELNMEKVPFLHSTMSATPKPHRITRTPARRRAYLQGHLNRTISCSEASASWADSHLVFLDVANDEK